MTPEPGDLYQLHLEDPAFDEAAELASPILVHALDGYVDAGNGVSLAVSNLIEELPHTVIGTFDADVLLDYRSRRPVLTFDRNAWSAYDTPKLELLHVTDAEGTGFLLLTGPEPDVMWERFVSAVGEIVDRFGVRTTVGLMAIPMAVPHTRPAGMTSHATRAELLPERHEDWVGTVQVPGHATGLLEFRFGEQGRDAIGLVAHVPHYLARTEYPATSVQLLQALSELTGLKLPLDGLSSRAAGVRERLDAQIVDNDEVAQVVKGLENQYDAFMAANGRSLLGTSAPLPTAEELGAQFEAFLAEREN